MSTNAEEMDLFKELEDDFLGGLELDQVTENPEEELARMKKRVAELEEEGKKLRDENEANKVKPNYLTHEDKVERDLRSIFVGNVDYAVTPDELQNHFRSCGAINKVSIMMNKETGRPKGFGYIEFSDPSLVANALVLNESILNGRPLKVIAKRTNVPGVITATETRGRGKIPRGGRPGGRYRGRRPNYKSEPY